MLDGTRFDLASLTDAYAAGLSPEAVVGTVMARLRAADDPGIFIHCEDEAALRDAARALGRFDRGRTLWGIPCAVKDNIDVAGMATTAACPAFAYRPQADAAVVARLRAAGALIVGKTNLDQFATGLCGVRTPYPVPRNAIDAALVPGGSSSGSAVAVARGIVSFALGTDTAGSGRVPAGLNNIVGLKPSLGALSTRGVVPACRSIDCVSIFALTVEDAWRVLAATAGFDALDPFCRALRIGPLARPAHVRLGVPLRSDRRFFGDAAMERGYEDALCRLRGLGCTLVELPFAAFYAAAGLLYDGAFVAERLAAIRPFFAAQPAALHPITRQIIAGSDLFSAADAFQALYELRALQAAAAAALEPVDALCVPTAPTHATLAQLEAEPIAANSRAGTYTNFVNLLDLCGTAVPCGRRADGLPMSVTVLARSGQDGLAAALARDLHAATAGTLGATMWGLPPLAPVAGEGDGRIKLAVVGAHLSGLPLNGQLRELGAVFERATHTAPGYRLYALPGQSPAKPGLLRDRTGAGGIELEIWRLTPDSFGRFVAAVPPPLSIGTIELQDGGRCQGFLAEAEAVAGAEDITGYGGWRRFVGRCGPLD